MASADTSCLICDLEQAPEPARVFRDDLWAAETVPGYDVPGWLFLRVRRHGELITGLTEEELTTFGPRARDLVAAVTEVTGSAATYLFTFGENYRHFHAMVTPRGVDIPPEMRSGNLLRLLPEGADTQASRALVPRLRAAYAARAGAVA